MSPPEITEERRRGRAAGAATIVAGLLIAVGIVWSGFVNRDRPDSGDAERLRFFDDHAGELIAASSVRALGFLLLVFTVLHLHRATRARNPELASVPLVIGLFGAVAIAAGSIGQAFALGNEAADFVTQQFASERAADRAAEDAATEPLPLAMSVMALAGTIALSFWFVVASLNAMRVGLLTRFMGVLGIIVGPGFIFGFAPPVMVFWLVAVGILFLGRWPRGLPPAWETGEAVPWPGRGERADLPEETPESATVSRDGEVETGGEEIPGFGAENGGQAGGDSVRRKRKRRR